MPYDILVVDDEADIRDLICDALKDEGYNARKASDGISAFAAINEHVPTVVILDIWLQGSELDGLGILEIIKKKYPYLPVIMISGHGTIETAVNSIKLGAYDYIEKPFTEDKLLVTIKRACEVSKLLKENAELKLKVSDKSEMIGSSPAILQLKSVIEKVAPTSGRVLICGPSGSGKELVARFIHKKSRRANEPFVVLSVAGMSQEKINLELFGEEEKNTNINDRPRKIGILEVANHGTLFIDEVADLPISAQNKILRFLQDQNFERPGSNRVIKLDVRIIAATSKDLSSEISKGNFRQDLFYRLNVVPIKVPSLSERREDVPLLCNFFLKYLQGNSGLPARIISEEAIAAMQAYSWPGNVRQLKNVIEWLLIMTQGSYDEQIKANMLPPEILTNGITIARPESNFDMMSMPLREAREIFERQYLAAQMNRFNGNISRTSAFVGMERSALHRKLKSLNIHAANLNNEEIEIEGVAG
jgi:two-component system nitrogen regulation response regulator NtrX